MKLIQHIHNVINKDKITSIKYLQQLQTRVPFVGKVRVKIFINSVLTILKSAREGYYMHIKFETGLGINGILY